MVMKCIVVKTAIPCSVRRDGMQHALAHQSFPSLTQASGGLLTMLDWLIREKFEVMNPYFLANPSP